MQVFKYKSFSDIISKICDIDCIRIIDASKSDGIEKIFSDYVCENQNEYYTLIVRIINEDLETIFTKINSTEIEEVELLKNNSKKYYINFVEKIIQIYLKIFIH